MSRKWGSPAIAAIVAAMITAAAMLISPWTAPQKSDGEGQRAEAPRSLELPPVSLDRLAFFTDFALDGETEIEPNCGPNRRCQLTIKSTLNQQRYRDDHVVELSRFRLLNEHERNLVDDRNIAPGKMMQATSHGCFYRIDTFSRVQTMDDGTLLGSLLLTLYPDDCDPDKYVPTS